MSDVFRLSLAHMSGAVRCKKPDTAGHAADDSAGPVELLQAKAHAFHAYFAELENRTSLDLPHSQEELNALDFRNLKGEVRELAAVYSFR